MKFEKQRFDFWSCLWYMASDKHDINIFDCSYAPNRKHEGEIIVMNRYGELIEV